ncbi:conserved hypothetical protein [Ricinus communis]|uniref:Uncharacterized protein n=1 Tax=Ricinus communis TaxID=3988 RepID=B9SFU2_RICCO|nr:conserved hypothetical protein [Ricinus communis]
MFHRFNTLIAKVITRTINHPPIVQDIFHYKDLFSNPPNESLEFMRAYLAHCNGIPFQSGDKG